MNSKDKEELIENMSEQVATMAFVFVGKLKNFFKVLEFLEDLEDAKIIYKKAANKHLYICTSKEGGSFVNDS